MSESRVRKSTYNMIAGFVNQVISLLLSFVSRTVFIYALGEEYLGLNGIFSDVLNLLSMADLGFNTAMAYSFYRPLAEHDEKALTALVNFYRKVYNIIAVLVTVAGVAVTPFLRLIVNTQQEIPLLEVYYFFALAGIVISYLFVYKTTILTADQKNYEVTKITIWTNLLKTVVQIGILLLSHNYIAYLAVNVFFQFLNNAIASRKATKHYPYIRGREKLEKGEEKAILDNMKSVFIFKISGTLFNGVDNILISVLVGTVAVGFYSNYLLVGNKMRLVIQIIFSSLTASIGNLIVKEKSEKRYQIFEATQSVSYILCGIIVCVYFLTINDLIRVWLGERFLFSTGAVAAMTLNLYLSCVLQPLWAYRDATGLYRKTKYVMLVGAVLNLVLSAALGVWLGVTGIVLASSLARLCTYFWYEPKLLFREYFDCSAGGYFISQAKNLLLVLITIAVLELASRRFVIDSWLALSVKGISIGAICCIVFFGAYVRSEGFLIIRRKAAAILKRHKGDEASCEK